MHFAHLRARIVMRLATVVRLRRAAGDAWRRADSARARQLLLALYVVAIAVVAVRNGLLSSTNDFAIFRASSGHLLAGRDLYARYPAEHDDRFKYSPTFALLLAPLSALPFA